MLLYIVLPWLISRCFLNRTVFDQYVRRKCKNIMVASSNIELICAKRIFRFRSVPIENDTRLAAATITGYLAAAKRSISYRSRWIPNGM